MPRYKLTLEYDGSSYCGWQQQKNGVSLYSVLRAAAEKLSGERIAPVVAGRTDAGVHALGQVAHLDFTRLWEPATLQNALNFYLKPAPMAVLECQLVPDSFHARFSALSRRYRYVIINRAAPLTIERHRAWLVRPPLVLEEMQHGAALLLGTHDFTSFRATECQAKSPLRTLDSFVLQQEGNRITATIQARSFLHHQVRNMIGTLKLVGEGKIPPSAISDILAARDRRAAGPTAPPDGLYLTAVSYPAM